MQTRLCNGQICLPGHEMHQFLCFWPLLASCARMVGPLKACCSSRSIGCRGSSFKFGLLLTFWLLLTVAVKKGQTGAVTPMKEEDVPLLGNDLCKNAYHDIGVCMQKAACDNSSGVHIGFCNLFDGSNSIPLKPGICCRHLSCSLPEVPPQNDKQRPKTAEEASLLKSAELMQMGISGTKDIRKSADAGQDGVDLHRANEFGQPLLQVPLGLGPHSAISQRCGLRSPMPTSPNDIIPFLTFGQPDFGPGPAGFSPNDISMSTGRTPFSLTTRASSDSGGRGRDAQIINGNSISGDNMFPWMLALWQDMGSGFIIPTCGAALVSPSHAITAAHCVINHGARYVLRGGSRVNKMPSPFANQIPGLSQSGGVAIDVTEISIHPQFNPFNFENDIAMIRFTKPVTFTRDLFPVCLPTPVSGDRITDYEGELATVTGWGCESEVCNINTVPTVLRSAVIPVISNDLAMCWFTKKTSVDGQNEYIPSQIFLVGGDESGSTSTCRGDSGSPVVRAMPMSGLDSSSTMTEPGLDPGRRFEVIGLVSWSKGCGRPFRPSVWTRVESFADWVIHNMNLV